MGRSAPYEQILNEYGAAWTTFREAKVVDDFGDAEAEYRAVRFDGLGIADRSERETVVADGDDAVPFIQGLVTSDVFKLAEPGSGQLSSCVNVKGRLVSDPRILHLLDVLILDFEPGSLEEGAVRHLKRNAITEDVRFTDRSQVTSHIGVFGARAASMLESIAVVDSSLSSLANYHGVAGSVAGCDAVIQRIPVTGEAGFDVSCSTRDAAEIWRALFEADDAARPVGHRALERLRIEAGVPRFGVELDQNIIPLEAGLDDTIAYDKGCYLGQEIIARIDTLGTPAKILRTLVLDDAPDDVDLEAGFLDDRLVGAEIEDEGKKVGEIRSITRSALMERPIALAYLKRKHNDVGRRVDVVAGDQSIPATVRPVGIALENR